jgi:RNA polymerase sigma factor (sigma-70 family)
MLKQIDKNFIHRLQLIARGIAKGNCDPDELVNGVVTYLMDKKEKYNNHPNLIAFAVWKMKNLFIDYIRKNKNLTSLTDKEGKDLEFADDKQIPMDEKISLSSDCKNVLQIIKTMNEKCQEILMLAADDQSYAEMAEIADIKIGTVMSRLANCRKELKGLLAT